MTTFNQLNSKISDAVINNGDLFALRKSFVLEQYKLSKFMDMFIEKVGPKIMDDRTKSPEWKLYTAKTDEFNSYGRAIRITDYYLAKKNLQIK